MFKVRSHVPKGGPLTPLLFNIIINTVFLNFFPCRVLLFAYDAKLFIRISSTNDCYVLQASLDGFIIWCETVGLTLNEDKCKFMSLVLGFIRRHTTEFN